MTSGAHGTADSVQTPDSFFQRIVDSSPDGILLADKNHILRYLNESAAEMLGFGPEELNGEPLPFELEVGEATSIKRTNGDQHLEIDLRSEFCEWQNEEVILITLRDVTAQRRLESDLSANSLRLDEVLKDVARVELALKNKRVGALGEMVMGISHDLNNSLTPIVGYSDMLLRSSDSVDERLRPSIESIHQAAREAAGAVQRLSRFCKMSSEHGDYEAIDLNEVVRQSVLLTQPRWKSQSEARGSYIHVTTDLEELPRVHAKEHELREILTVLIFNSIEAMESGGDIHISTRNDGARNVLKVADNGSGMTDEVKKQCLDPFYTTKGDSTSGLGLPLVYGVVHRHHGSIEIESAPGEGTTITVRFPVSENAGVEVSEVADASPVDREIPPLRILLIDDQPSVTRAIQQLLEMDGHTVLVFSNGQDGLDAYSPGRFDLVITDRAMPDLNGHEVARRIRSQGDTPIIMLTGFGDTMDTEEDLSDDVDLLLGKPIALDDLRNALHTLV